MSCLHVIPGPNRGGEPMQQQLKSDGERPSGVNAMLGAVVAVVGVFAAANPQNAWLRAITDAEPRLATGGFQR